MVAMATVVDLTLRGTAGEYRVPSPWWVALTSLAVGYGWQPGLVSLSDRPEAPCDLILARVTDEDARGLADALEAALPDIPDHDALATYPECRLVWDARSAGGPLLCRLPGLAEWLSGTNKQVVPDVIAFARTGGVGVDDPST
jgi:hypothetical protein